jgi:hypothetical protein
MRKPRSVYRNIIFQLFQWKNGMIAQEKQGIEFVPERGRLTQRIFERRVQNKLRAESASLLNR